MATLISSRRKTRHREEWSPAPAHCRAWGENRRNAFIDNPGPAEIHDSSGVRKIFRAEGSLAHQRFDDSAHASFNEQRSEYRSDNAAYQAIAPKLGCAPDSLRGWCRQSERDAGARNGPTSEEKARIKDLEREVRELRQANEILKKASAYFAQAELDRPFRK